MLDALNILILDLVLKTIIKLLFKKTSIKHCSSFEKIIAYCISAFIGIIVIYIIIWLLVFMLKVTVKS